MWPVPCLWLCGTETPLLCGDEIYEQKGGEAKYSKEFQSTKEILSSHTQSPPSLSTGNIKQLCLHLCLCIRTLFSALPHFSVMVGGRPRVKGRALLVSILMFWLCLFFQMLWTNRKAMGKNSAIHDTGQVYLLPLLFLNLLSFESVCYKICNQKHGL